jgi:phenylpropionate dioxygenase-like ring-hydroxylating dioxygenase large terminal subunit
MFPLNHWYVAAFSSELEDWPVARTLLNHAVVLFRNKEGKVAALEDRCCHRNVPLSLGTVDGEGIRCGYHGMLYASSGKCIEIPGQDKIPAKAGVRAYTVAERNHIVWIWMGVETDGKMAPPDREPPEYAVHDHPKYRYKVGFVHYDAPYQLIHDNLLDLSHLGYVHGKTIGGNPNLHMQAPTRVESEGDMVRVVRWMKNSVPPATYSAAWPYKGKIDRWQEIDFHVTFLAIWTGAVDVDTDALEDPGRGGLHMRGFHGVTPETDSSSHYFWSMASTSHPDAPDNRQLVYDQTEQTFLEDKVIIEAQYKNMLRFGPQAAIDIHVDAGPNRARRIIERLNSQFEAAEA